MTANAYTSSVHKEQAMARTNVTELRQNLPAYLERVQKGEAVEVTVRGRVVARIVPGEDTRESARRRLEALRGSVKLGDIMSPSGDAWDAERGRS